MAAFYYPMEHIWYLEYPIIADTVHLKLCTNRRLVPAPEGRMIQPARNMPHPCAPTYRLDHLGNDRSDISEGRLGSKFFKFPTLRVQRNQRSSRSYPWMNLKKKKVVPLTTINERGPDSGAGPRAHQSSGRSFDTWYIMVGQKVCGPRHPVTVRR